MSDFHTRRLRLAEAEFIAAREALAFVVRRWDADNLTTEIPDVALQTFALALQNAKKTYFIRLFAEFEGLLKDHLSTNHPARAVPEKPKIDQLIALVIKADALSVDPMLRRKINQVRDYRNALAHTAMPAVYVELSDAHSYLNTFVAKLPAPLH